MMNIVYNYERRRFGRNQTKVGLKDVQVWLNRTQPYAKKSDQGGIERKRTYRRRSWRRFRKKSDQGGIERGFLHLVNRPNYSLKKSDQGGIESR